MATRTAAAPSAGALLPVRSSAWSPRQLCRSASVLLLAGLLMGSALLLVRRSMASAQPLEPALLPVAALALVLTAWLARRLWRLGGRPVGRVRLALLASTSTSLILFGFALGATSLPWWAALVYWAIVMLEEGWSWTRPLVKRNSFRSPHSVERNSFRSVSTRTQPSPHDHAGASRQRLTQEYTRASLADGQELIRGALHLALLDGTRVATAHVAFCPPFAERPQFDVRLTAGPACRVKLGQLLPQGARIEIKLHAPAAATDRLSLEFTAHGQALP